MFGAFSHFRRDASWLGIPTIQYHVATASVPIRPTPLVNAGSASRAIAQLSSKLILRRRRIPQILVEAT